MNNIISFLLVAAGGAIGSAARYAVGGLLLDRTLDLRFPVGTFAANVAGCLFIGLLGGLAVKHDLFSADARLFLFTGLAGGFTTFSSFGLETFYLLRRHEPLMAGGYVVASVVIGLLALWCGFSVISARV